jgi:methionyl-tRNA synthetase
VDDLEIHRALEAIFKAVDATNQYLEKREPWKAAKDPARADTVPRTLYTCCEALRIVALLLSPFLPETACEILKRLGVPTALDDARLPEDAAWGGIREGAATTKGEPLFPRVELEVEAS